MNHKMCLIRRSWWQMERGFWDWETWDAMEWGSLWGNSPCTQHWPGYSPISASRFYWMLGLIIRYRKNGHCNLQSLIKFCFQIKLWGDWGGMGEWWGLKKKMASFCCPAVTRYCIEKFKCIQAYIILVDCFCNMPKSTKDY